MPCTPYGAVPMICSRPRGRWCLAGPGAGHHRRGHRPDRAVGALKRAGAQYVLVPNLPDVGITPQFRGPNAAAATALSAGYNKALYGGLKRAGIEFIPLDTFSILREVTANPGMYGFTNVTSTCKIDPANSTQSILTCNPTSYVARMRPTPTCLPMACTDHCRSSAAGPVRGLGAGRPAPAAGAEPLGTDHRPLACRPGQHAPGWSAG